MSDPRPLAGRATGPTPPLPGRALVLGGGVMGTGIAAQLAAAGVEVVVLVRRRAVVDVTEEEIRRRGGGAVRVVTEAEPPFALAVESIAEDLDAKRAVLARAERLLAGDGILATNTSSLSLSDLADGLERPERFAGWHWFNPAELVPLVEVVGSARTAPATIERLLALSRALGKEPIAVRRAVPGFVANRLQYALIREAYALVEEGVCDVEDVDRAVVAGLGARWAAIGPFASMDAAGLEVHEAAAARLFPELSRSTAVPRMLRELRSRGATGVRGGSGLRGAYSPAAARRMAERRDATLALLAGGAARMITAETLVLGEDAVLPADVAAVARGRPATLGDAARERMDASHALLQRLLDAGEPVYGLTTGVGALKTVRVEPGAQAEFQRLLLRSHLMGHGELAPDEFVRAAMVVRAAGLARGVSGVRPVVAEAFCHALETGLAPPVHMLGSIGQADLSQMAEIGLGLVQAGLVLGPREAHAIVNSNAFSVGVACLALDLAERALRALDLAAATSLEALVGNVDAIHPMVGAVRPHPGAVETIARLRELLRDGALLDGARPPRFLQDPLAFKGIPQAHGAARQALGHCEEALRVELAGSGDSPIMLLDEGRAISTGNHDISPVAIALDYARLGLAQAVTIAGERVQKLLTAGFTGLSTGLRADAMAPAEGLAEIGNGAASLAGEARLLAQPVSLELPTSAIAEGVEGRITMAPTAARRLHEMAGLALRLAAVELECAAQAVDLRGRAGELGAGTRRAYEEVRRTVQFVGAGEAGSTDLDQLTEWLANGEVP